MAVSGDTPTLESVLPSSARPSLCGFVLPTLLDCISSIASAMRTSHHVSQIGTANAFGDDQLNVDVLAERIIREAIANSPYIATASSEEEPYERPYEDEKKSSHNETERYTLAFDPLDGSSIIPSNWTVGTIIGVWDGTTALHQHPRDKLIASVLGVYGPRTTAIVALRIPNSAPTCFEVGLDGNNARDIIRPSIHLHSPPFKTRFFAPANLRAAAEDELYMQLVTHYVSQKYTLRYSGGLVPDVVHALIKGHGIYVSPVTDASKTKLRRLFELAPIALVVECAGGMAVDPIDGKDILEREIRDCDERAGLVCGTKEEVEYVKRFLLRQ